MVGGIIAAVVVLTIVGLVGRLIVGGMRLSAEHEARFEQGTRATATIQRVEQQRSNATHRRSGLTVRLHLQVEPPDEEPYAAVTGVNVQTVSVPRLQPGERLAVRIAKDDRRLVYPDEDWADMDVITISGQARD